MNNQTTYSVEQQRGINQFIAKSLMWMIVGLLVSAVSAFFILQSPKLMYLIYGNRFGVFILFGVQLVLAYMLRVNPEKLESSASYITKFVLYSAITGFTFAAIALVYTSQSIAQAFITTAALFGILCLYGYNTKRDLTKIGNLLMPALLGVIVMTLLNVIVFRSNGMELVLTILTMIIFIGLTMYDMQKIKSLYLYFEEAPQTHTSLSISCALELYLDFINLFISILRLFGRGRD